MATIIISINGVFLTPRVVAATNRDLRQEVKRGTFRADLYHRLSVLTLSVPPLRELDADKLLLLEQFRRMYAEKSGVQPFSLDAQAERRWLEYQFPGNVRELRNIVIRPLGDTCRHKGTTLLPPPCHSTLGVFASLRYPVSLRLG